MSTELAYLPATEALRAFRSRDLSPVELMQAVIARAEQTEPQVNCLSERLFDEGLAAARTAEARYLGKGDAPRPLEGIPVAAKDEHPIAGRLCSEGSLLLADEIATETHPVIERVQAAGGIVHARTTTPEFCCAAFTQSRMWGVTRNPWSLAHSCGGSSGGSGAALAAGNAPLATGSDIGGSIRIPASFNGVVGFKPPYGRVPAMPPFNLDTFCHDGPMARTIGDTVLLQNTIAGPHHGDIASLRPKLDLPTAFEGVAGMRIALTVTLGDYPVDPDVEANTRAVADALRAGGALVEEVALGWTRDLLDRAAWAHFGAIFGPSIAEAERSAPELLNAYTREFAARAAEAAATTGFLEGLEIEGRLYAELGALLERYDALLCPTTAIPALAADEDYTGTRLTIAGQEQPHYMAMAMTIGFNICSRCPVLSVPSGFSREGVPTGVQIVGRTYDDATVFRVGAAIETLRPWAYGPGHRPLVPLTA